MERKKKNLSKIDSRVHSPFQSMWSMTEKVTEYDALTDKHADYYFISPTMRRHISHLKKALKNEHKSSDNLAVNFNLKKKRKAVRKSIQEHETHENVKILPYVVDLKECSQVKFTSFKKNLQANLKAKNREHEQFLKTHWNTKRPDQPVIRLIRTLTPLENFLKTPPHGKLTNNSSIDSRYCTFGS